ncbi:TPA: hypothetical protein QCW42_004089 [Bacillus cereus]|nr:hypothetical protein [Bacillus cereus]
MDKKKEYDVLVEIVANARLLLAQSDNADVRDYAESVKVYARDAVHSLDYRVEMFSKDTISRYLELNELIKKEEAGENE